MKQNYRNLTLAATLLTSTLAAAQTTDSKTQVLTANMDAEVSLTLGAAPGPIALSTADNNETDISLTINSTNGFKIYATAPVGVSPTHNGANQGKFNEYNTTDGTYVASGAYVNATHSVTVPAGDTDGTGGTSHLPAAIDPTNTNANLTGLIYSSDKALAAKALVTKFRVTPPYGTPRLVSPKVYRMVITYTLNVNP